MFLSLSLSLVGDSLYADRGSIPFDPDVPIFEPSQKALIGWNGKEEILLLTTDMRASRDVTVLEVLPLPSEPQVKKGDLKAFVRAADLISRKLKVEAFKKARTKSPEHGAKGRGPAGEVTFHKRIGAHEIFVTRCLDRNRFCEWVYEFLAKKGVPGRKISPEFLSLIHSYLRKKFYWFVFDVIKLYKTLRTLTPIEYRFSTPYLYYPLRISALESGKTTVDLLVMTPKLLSKFPDLPIEKVQLRHKPVTISFDEIRWIDKNLSKLFNPQERVFLRIWRIEGKFSELKYDVIARE